MKISLLNDTNIKTNFLHFTNISRVPQFQFCWTNSYHFKFYCNLNFHSIINYMSSVSMPWILKDSSLHFYILVLTQSFILQHQDVMEPILLLTQREYSSEILDQGISCTMLKINLPDFPTIYNLKRQQHRRHVFLWGSSYRPGKLPQNYL